MADLSDDKLLADFDQLVEEGVIVYGPHELVEVDCDGYPFEFRICPALKRKPHQVGAVLDSSFDKSRKWGPGSDMYCPDERLIIKQLNGTHDLAHNLFCVDRPQYVVLTSDSYKKQHEPLDEDDMKVILEMLKELKGFYVIYNCGEAAGCSRSHKHIQGLIGPPTAFGSFIDEEKSKSIPFKFFSHHFEQGFEGTSSSELLKTYEALLEKAKDALNTPKESICPHNVVLWQDWLMVIPRRSGTIGGASANSGGMFGSVWVTDQDEVDKWTRIGVRQVLEGLGLPR
ncbi:hypothetical protein BDV96DRAFT_505521 [Lophiotrema nucula]|uniref:Uncharacterized protein n=1 Tax=Lophiotrema nucula TaxID=690887 RepID=A0A6A5YKR5_9PLEO|nr:hypothetical protein BDV96DRAFT_505521 [Lophiotrema nucula]